MALRRWLQPFCAPVGRPSRRLLPLTFCALFVAVGATAQDFEVVYEVLSQHQRITVIDTSNGYRQLLFDARFDGTDAIQSEMNLASPDELTLSYARHMIAAVPVAAGVKRILVVGLGGACIQRYLRKLLPDATIETAEHDPEIRDLATKFFFFKEDARQIVHLGDGRAFIERSKEKYDLILLDAFTAESIPHRLTTQEFLKAVKDRLADGGVVGANLWDAQASYWNMVKTYAAVFPAWRILKCAGSGNSILLAMPSATDLTGQAWADRAAAFEKVHPTGLDLPQLILRGVTATTIPDSARVLSDRGQGGQT